MAAAAEEGVEVHHSIYEDFNLKTSDDKKENVGKQGRLYSEEYSRKPGGIKVDEMIFGIKMAHLSCTDDSDGRLTGSGPNTLEALKFVVDGDEAETKKTLTEILKDHFDLTLDCWIDESGVKHGRAVDTQGFIASNEDTIVLSYRFSTTLLDWITNLSMTTSEWEPEIDVAIGHAGDCSCLDGYFRRFIKGENKPRVHTGFYNNFVYTIPMIRKHILNKILKSDCTPKKVYICGCSLGAAIATMAYCYVILEAAPALLKLPHKIISVTAGCPRVCGPKMRDLVMEKTKALQAKDKAVICRCVYNHDIVPHVPFNFGAFQHLDKLVYITTDGDVIINPKLKGTKRFAEVKNVFSSFWAEKKEKEANEKPQKHHGEDQKKIEGDGADEEEEEDELTPFEKEVESTPGPIKDHMPYWYLTFLQKLKDR